MSEWRVVREIARLLVGWIELNAFYQITRKNQRGTLATEGDNRVCEPRNLRVVNKTDVALVESVSLASVT